MAKAAHAVVQDALNAGVYVFAGGLELRRASVVATDGTVTDGPYPQTEELSGGFTVVDVPTREAALQWAAKIAVACRCAQEVREFGPDPELKMFVAGTSWVGTVVPEHPPITATHALAASAPRDAVTRRAEWPGGRGC